MWISFRIRAYCNWSQSLVLQQHEMPILRYSSGLCDYGGHRYGGELQEATVEESHEHTILSGTSGHSDQEECHRATIDGRLEDRGWVLNGYTDTRRLHSGDATDHLSCSVDGWDRTQTKGG